MGEGELDREAKTNCQCYRPHRINLYSISEILRWELVLLQFKLSTYNFHFPFTACQGRGILYLVFSSPPSVFLTGSSGWIQLKPCKPPQPTLPLSLSTMMWTDEYPMHGVSSWQSVITRATQCILPKPRFTHFSYPNHFWGSNLDVCFLIDWLLYDLVNSVGLNLKGGDCGLI